MTPSLFAPPTASSARHVAVVLPALAAVCEVAVTKMKKTPLQQRRAILQRPRIQGKKKTVVSSACSKKATPKAGAKKKQSKAKPKPKQSTIKKKMQSILTAEIFVSLRGDDMEPPIDDKGTSVEFFPEEMDAHDSEFNNQLTFQFNQKRKQSVLVWFAVFGCA